MHSCYNRTVCMGGVLSTSHDLQLLLPLCLAPLTHSLSVHQCLLITTTTVGNLLTSVYLVTTRNALLVPIYQTYTNNRDWSVYILIESRVQHVNEFVWFLNCFLCRRLRLRFSWIDNTESRVYRNAIIIRQQGTYFCLPDIASIIRTIYLSFL